MKLFRKIIFWLHLVVGIAAGVFIMLMSITGVALTYERQMLESADVPSFAMVGERLSIEQLAEKANAAAPAGTTLSALTLNSDATVPVNAAFGREASAWLNPHTGEKLEPCAPGLRKFLRTATDLHRWLSMSGDSRSTGKAITGASNLVFLFLVVSGLYLWFPRQWKWSAFRPAMWFRRKLSGRARDWNWHNVLGFWSCVPLFFIVLTGSFISYPWMTGLLYKAFGESPPAQAAPSRGGSPPGRSSAPTTISSFQGLNTLWAKAVAESPGWKTISLALPVTKSASFTIMGGHRGRPDLRSTLTLNPQTAAVSFNETFDSFSPARKARTWGRWLHTGEAGGAIGQTIAGLASAASCLLVWTGFALSWRRLRRKRAATLESAEPTGNTA